MKIAVTTLITSYQAVLSFLLKSLLGQPYICRFTPTCSEYTRRTVEKKGVIRGVYSSLMRILRCNPLFFNNA